MTQTGNRQAPNPDWTAPGIFEVLPGVHRIPLPLPGDALRAVNVYVLSVGDRLTLIDSGMGKIGLTRNALATALAQIGRTLGEIDEFLITHVHRDHYTFAVELREEFSTRIRLGIGEKPNIEEVAKQDRSTLIPIDQRLITAGAIELQERMAKVREKHLPWKFPDKWLRDHEKIQIGENELEVIATPGHTRGHVIFSDQERSIVFSGDHVLPHITPSIGFEPVPPESPLADYLVSLMNVRAMPDAQMLPAHGLPGGSMHHRIDELLAHHEHRLEQTREVIQTANCTALQVAEQLRWTRREHHFATLDIFNQMLAVNETLAHLDVLVSRGSIHRSFNAASALYTAVPTPSRK